MSGTTLATRRPMLVVFTLSLVALLAEVGYQTTAVAAMPYFLRDMLNLPVARIGLINMAFLVAETGAKIPFGNLSDRYGRKLFVVGGPILSALAAFAVTRVPPPYVVMGLRAIDGVGAAMLWPATFATIADVVDEKRRATAMSLFNLMYIGGLVLGPLLYSVVFARTQSHTAIFYLLGEFFLLAVLMAALVTPRRGQSSTPAPSAEVCVPEERQSAWGVIRHNPILMAMLFIAIIQFSGLHMLNGVLSIYLKEQIGISEARFGHLFLYIGAVVGVFALPMGRLADKMGKPAAIRIGLGVCAVGMWILPWVSAVPLLVIAAAIFGVGFLLASPAWLALMTELAGEKCRGGVVGIMNTAQGVGASLGVAIGSALYTYLAPRAPFLASALMFTVSVVIVFRYVRDEE